MSQHVVKFIHPTQYLAHLGMGAADVPRPIAHLAGIEQRLGLLKAPVVEIAVNETAKRNTLRVDELSSMHPLERDEEDMIEAVANVQLPGREIIALPVNLRSNADAKLVGLPVVVQILAENSTAETGPDGVYFKTQEASTRLMLDDGATGVIAGLTVTSNTKVKIGVPGLSQIPILGRLFSYHKDVSEEEELVIIITARIVRPGGGTEEPESGTPEAPGGAQ